MTKAHSIFRSIALLAVASTLVVACGGSSGSNQTGKANFALKVGVGAPFTGVNAPYGQPVLTAAQFAADLVNAAAKNAGVKTTVTVVSEDTQSTPTGASEAAVKLVQSDQVSVIIGDVSTSDSIPMAQAASIPNHVVQMSLASSPLITSVNDNDYLWRTVPSDAAQAPKLAKYMATVISASGTVNTLAPNDPGFTAFQVAFEGAWKTQGGKIGESVTYNPTELSFDSDAQKLVSGNPDAWMIYDIPGNFARFAPALIRTGKWDAKKAFAGDGLAVPTLPKQAGSPATEGMRGTSFSHTAGAGAAFNTYWASKTSVPQLAFEPNSFDALILCYLAALRGGSASGTVIRDNLRSLADPQGTTYNFLQLEDAIKAIVAGQKINYVGASGVDGFDASGDPKGSFYEVWKFSGGQLTTLIPSY
jgi:ABC-type branched-subunit amino acid transport system substrate-binding protein